MTVLVDVSDVNVWLSQKKTQVTAIEEALAEQLADTVIGVVSQRYNTGNWISINSTPLLIKRIISMFYAGYYYNRSFSNEADPGTYGDRLLADAQTLLDGIANGTISIPTDVAIPIQVIDNTPSIATELLLSEPMFSMSQEF